MLGCLPRLHTPQLSGNKMLGSRDGFSFMYVALSGFLINLRTLVWQKTNAICLLKSVRERIKVFLVFLFTNKGSGSHVACARHKSISTQSTQQWTPGIGTQASDKFLTQPIPSTLSWALSSFTPLAQPWTAADTARFQPPKALIPDHQARSNTWLKHRRCTHSS